MLGTLQSSVVPTSGNPTPSSVLWANFTHVANTLTQTHKLKRVFFFFFVNFKLLNYFYVYVCACLGLCPPHVYKSQWKPEEGAATSETGVTDGSEQPCRCWELMEPRSSVGVVTSLNHWLISPAVDWTRSCITHLRCIGAHALGHVLVKLVG